MHGTHATVLVHYSIRASVYLCARVACTSCMSLSYPCVLQEVMHGNEAYAIVKEEFQARQESQWDTQETVFDR